MDKKNTILLTVIAVATLLVAVVGATFAFYSVSTQNNTTKATYTVTGDSVGAIALTSPNTALDMTITPTDMAQFGEDKLYYALIGSDSTEANTATTKGRYAVKRKNYDMAVATLTGGNTETAYTCTATLTVTLITTNQMGEVITQNDAILYLDGIQTTLDNQTSQVLDLSTIKDTGTKVYNVIYKVNGNPGKQIAKIQADLKVTNLTSKDQKYLAGKTLTVSIDSDHFNCTIDKEMAKQ